MKIEGTILMQTPITGVRKSDGQPFTRPAFIVQHNNEMMYFDVSEEKFSELQRQGLAQGANGTLNYWQSVNVSQFNGRTYNTANAQSWVPAAAQQVAAPAQQVQQAPQMPQQPVARATPQPVGNYTQLAQMQQQPVQQPQTTMPFAPSNAPAPY